MIKYHHPGAQRILELPIYRCTEERHYEEQEAKCEFAAQWTRQSLRMLNKGPQFDKEQMDSFRTDWFAREGCSWDFNQVIGWIWLYARAGNIGAYLFLVNERISKTMVRKRYKWDGYFLEMSVADDHSSAELFDDLRKRILAESRRWFKGRRFYVDIGVLDVLGPHLDWVALTTLGRTTRCSLAAPSPTNEVHR